VNIVDVIYRWTLQRNIRTWFAHRWIVLAGGLVHPLVAAGLATWYLIRERRQVAASGKGWTPDALADVLFPVTESVAVLWVWLAGYELSLVGLLLRYV
jgi:hypothetical protein